MNPLQQNILIIGLLRFGDIVMMSSAVKKIRQQHPDGQITFMVNQGFEKILDLLSEIDNVKVFPRSSLQGLIKNVDESVFAAIDELDRFIEPLINEYSVIYNLTHNKLSSYIAAEIDADEKFGLSFSGNKHLVVGEGFKFLNDIPAMSTGSGFHYVDALSFAVSEFDCNSKINNSIDNSRVDKVPMSGRFFTVQPLTSDSKKNWSVDRWRKTLLLLTNKYPEHKVYLLGSRCEEELLNTMSTGIAGASAYVCSFAEAASVLQQSEALITLDTSIKHIAAAVNTPIVELSLGSSDYHFTGAYSDKAVIIDPVISCHPCKHSTSCSKPTFECHDQIYPEMVMQALNVLLSGSGVADYQAMYGQLTELVTPFHSDAGFWFPLIKSRPEYSFTSLLVKVALIYHLRDEDGQSIKPLASYAWKIEQDVKNNFPDSFTYSSLKTITQVNDYDYPSSAVENIALNLFDVLSRIQEERVSGEYKIL